MKVFSIFLMFIILFVPVRIYDIEQWKKNGKINVRLFHTNAPNE